MAPAGTVDGTDQVGMDGTDQVGTIHGIAGDSEAIGDFTEVPGIGMEDSTVHGTGIIHTSIILITAHFITVTAMVLPASIEVEVTKIT